MDLPPLPVSEILSQPARRLGQRTIWPRVRTEQELPLVLVLVLVPLVLRRGL